MEHIGSILNNRAAPARSKLTTKEQVTAWEIAEYCGETKRFGMYARMVKTYGVDKARLVLDTLKHSVNVRNPGKLFIWLITQKANKNNIY